MTDTRLLNFIRQEMKKQGITWKKEQELFELLIPNEPWASYRTSWSNWKQEKVHYLQKSPHIRLAIGKTLHFDANVWGASDWLQKEAVQKGVKKAFLEKGLPDWGQIIPSFTLSFEQKNVLEDLKYLSLGETEEKLKKHAEYFERNFENQAFLLALLEDLYAKGAYDLLVLKVFPNLLSHQRGELRVKVMEAHSLGSLKEPKYMQSVKLLESIEDSSEKKVIDLKTSMLSNLRRYHAQNKNLSTKELLHGMEVMAKMYYELFLYDERYHYYPAINLLYVVQVYNALSKNKFAVDVNDVFRKAKASIKEEKESPDANCLYYASVTEFEFALLLGEKGVVRKMALMLTMQKPSMALVHRTKRQMLEFVAMIRRVEAGLGGLLVEFEKVITLLGDYEKEVGHGK